MDPEALAIITAPVSQRTRGPVGTDAPRPPQRELVAASGLDPGGSGLFFRHHNPLRDMTQTQLVGGRPLQVPPE